jgi:putative ABC transport system permease protein
LPGPPAPSDGGSSSQAEEPATAQALFLDVDPGSDPLAVAAAVDDATRGETHTITPAEAVASLPGMSQQSTTFGYIRLVTLGVALVVVGLFLSFVTLERTPLYAVLKALGMSSRQLFTGVVVQVLLVTISAAVVAAVATWGLTHVPLELPTTMRPIRLVETVVALGVTSVVGSVLSLRRVVRVDPASAIG